MNTNNIKARLIEMNVTGITVDPFTNAPIVILKGHADDSIALPIWIGALEASAIAAEMEDVKFTRPMTHDLLLTFMKKAMLKVERIEITDLVDNVYYANIFIEDSEGQAHCIDSRPSDAIAIALRMDATILVSIDVIERSEELDHSKTPQQQCIKKQSESEPAPDSDSLQEMLEDLSPEAFGKYKM